MKQKNRDHDDYINAISQAIDEEYSHEHSKFEDVYDVDYKEDYHEDYEDYDEDIPTSKPPRRVRRFFLTILLVLVLLAGGTFVFITFFMPSPVNRDAFTILIAGQDNIGTHGLTDTLMVLRVDSAGNAVDIVSIPRDTRADVSWRGPKINSVFAVTGGNIYRLMEEVEKLIGFMPDFYVVLNLEAFVEIVDALGGVYLNVPSRMQYTDTWARPPLHINLEPGYQRLSGEQSMHFIRFRAGTGDLGRVARQQTFFNALIEETVKVQNIIRVPQLMGVISEHVDTNLSTYAMIYTAAHMLRADNINTHIMPTESFGSDLAPVLTPWLEMINNHLNPYPMPVTLDNLRLFTRRNGTIQLSGSGQSLSQSR
jgi:LCP family protein required for cell wall assembly